MTARAGAKPRWVRALTILLGLAAAANVAAWSREMVLGGIHNDYAIYLTLTYVGVHSGWPHVYDWEATRPVIHLFGSHYWPTPQNSDALGNGNQYLPLTMLLFVPFLYLPYEVGDLLWLAIITVALLATWWVLAPDRWRLANLFVMLASLPVGFALWLGQVVPLVAVCIAVSWKLLEDRRDFIAGVVLAGVLVKPNLAVLVPVALVFNGRPRAIAGLATAGAVAGLVTFALLQPYGVIQYIDHLRSVSLIQSHEVLDSGLTMVGIFGIGPALLGADLVVLAAVAWIAFTTRAEGAAAGFAAAIAGSLLVTTYLHWQDLLMVLPAGWLWLRSRAAARHTVPWLVVVLLVASFTIAVPQVLMAWLALMVAETVWGRRRAPVHTSAA